MQHPGYEDDDGHQRRETLFSRFCCSRRRRRSFRGQAPGCWSSQTLWFQQLVSLLLLSLPSDMTYLVEDLSLCLICSSHSFPSWTCIVYTIHHYLILDFGLTIFRFIHQCMSRVSDSDRTFLSINVRVACNVEMERWN